LRATLPFKCVDRKSGAGCGVRSCRNFI
jgi:hypothetical protein